MCDLEKIEQLKFHYQEILKLIGEDVTRDGLLKTPERAAKAILELTQGYGVDAVATLNSALFDEVCKNMVIVKDIQFYSLCEHHILPFYGKVHVAYIPNEKIVGLSKIARIVDAFSKRLQVQERLTKQIVQSMEQALNPKGVIVVVEAEHMCMQMRGVEKPGTVTTTIDYCGDFEIKEFRDNFFENVDKLFLLFNCSNLLILC